MNRQSWEHHGIYFTALFIAWNTPGCRLPADDVWLSMHFGCSANDFNDMVQPILEKYFKRRGQFLYQKRLTKERDFVDSQSDKQREKAKIRWGKGKDDCHGNAGEVPRLSHGNAPTPIPPPLEEVSNKGNIIGFAVGKKIGNRNGVTIPDPANRLAIFQRTLAESIGKELRSAEQGWLIVGRAADPSLPEYHDALAFCKKHAKEKLDKGWPLQWPKQPNH